MRFYFSQIITKRTSSRSPFSHEICQFSHGWHKIRPIVCNISNQIICFQHILCHIIFSKHLPCPIPTPDNEVVAPVPIISNTLIPADVYSNELFDNCI